MKRFSLFASALLTAAVSLPADRITTTAIACPTMEAFKKIHNYQDTSENKELFIMQQGCVVLTPKDKIHVIDPEHKTHGMFLKIQVDRTNEIMYVRKNYVKVEQAGTGNILRF
ncbi:hypothetical protein [Hydrogenimonas sp.]